MQSRSASWLHKITVFNISTHISGVKSLSAAEEILSWETMVSAWANFQVG